jgi:hypothetical protein
MYNINNWIYWEYCNYGLNNLYWVANGLLIVAAKLVYLQIIEYLVPKWVKGLALSSQYGIQF